MNTPSYTGLWEIIIKQKLLARIDNLSDKFFSEVVADTVVLYLNKTKKDFFEINSFHENSGLSDHDELSFTEINAPDYKINIHTKNNIIPLIKKIDSQSSALQKYFHTHVGMMIKNKKTSIYYSREGNRNYNIKMFFPVFAYYTKICKSAKSYNLWRYKRS